VPARPSAGFGVYPGLSGRMAWDRASGVKFFHPFQPGYDDDEFSSFLTAHVNGQHLRDSVETYTCVRVLGRLIDLDDVCGRRTISLVGFVGGSHGGWV